MKLYRSKQTSVGKWMPRRPHKMQ